MINMHAVGGSERMLEDIESGRAGESMDTKEPSWKGIVEIVRKETLCQHNDLMAFLTKSIKYSRKF